MISSSSHRLVTSFVLISCLIIATYSEIPPYLKICKANDPNLGKCIINSLENLRPYLAKGLPELGVPAIEPFAIGDLYQPSLNMTLTNMYIHEFTSFQIEDLTADFAKSRFAIVAKFTNLKITCQYSIDTKLVSIPLKGEGGLVTTLGTVHFIGKIKGKRKVVGGKTFINLSFPEFKIVNPTNVKIKLDRLFHLNEQLARAADIVVEDNAMVFVDSVIEVLEPRLKQEVTVVSNKILSTFSEEELFPKE